MTRKECLDEAAKCVLKDRQNQYGGPENNFERIAEMWSAYLGNVRVHSWDVAAMMGMLKLARARFNPKYADNWIDLAGYAACGIECATMDDEFDKSLDEFQKESMEHMFKKAETEGYEELVQKDAQELYQHIVDCNPAVFKTHKPTGEELAEMAREDANG